MYGFINWKGHDNLKHTHDTYRHQNTPWVFLDLYLPIHPNKLTMTSDWTWSYQSLVFSVKPGTLANFQTQCPSVTESSEPVMSSFMTRATCLSKPKGALERTP